MRVSLIISGKPLPQQQSLTHAFSYVTDIAPTIVELVGIGLPSTTTVAEG